LLLLWPGAAIAIDATGWEDVVVWNPHLTMKDW
jgi:glucose-6-phosphate 1-epimerase